VSAQTAPESQEVISAREGRSLDEWYRVINLIYLEPNFRQNAFSLFTHLVEVVGGLSLLVSKKPHKTELQVERYWPKALSWWLALCGRVGVASVETLLWTKFPYVCPYCRLRQHQTDPCDAAKRVGQLDWVALDAIGQRDRTHRPQSIEQWQRMFRTIYPRTDMDQSAATFARMTEELGELAEAVRVFNAEPSYFISEAADLFAWLMQLQNQFDRDGSNLTAGRLFAAEFPDRCRSCQQKTCVCPPIRPETLGRIAHEVPLLTASFQPGGNLLPLQVIRQQFQIAQEVRIGANKVVSITAADREALFDALTELKTFVANQPEHSPELTNELARLSEQQRLTVDALGQLRELLGTQPPPVRARAYEILVGVAGNTASEALMAIARYLNQS
jgi:NTP pyrophosphatase (non-canonical NTP hydrolase)